MEFDINSLRPLLADLAREIAKQVLQELRAHTLETESAAEQYLTPVQVARLSGFTLKALESMRSRREGPPYLKVGASVRYRASDVHAWLESGATHD